MLMDYPETQGRDGGRAGTRIAARIIMTPTQSIINLACIIRKHESGRVIKVLLVPPPPSSLCPDALFLLAAARLRGGAAPRVSSLCPTRIPNEERWKAGSGCIKPCGGGGDVESRLTVMKDPFSAELGPFYDLLNCIGRLIEAA